MPTFAETMDNVDKARAERLRSEYGRVKWIVSWHWQENEMWLARLSCPKIDRTFEALGLKRCDAIDAATRAILDALHKLALEEPDDTCPHCGK